MRNIIIIIFLFFSLIGFGQEEKTFSNIYEKQKEACGDKDYLKVFEQNRIKTGWIDKIEKQTLSDTIYVVEEYVNDVEVSREIYSATIWNKPRKKTGKNKKRALKLQSYSQEGDKIKQFKKKLIGSYLLYLVNEWKVEKIKEESQKDDFMYPSTLIATRIIILSHGDKKIDTFCFKEFYTLDIDDKYNSIITTF